MVRGQKQTGTDHKELVGGGVKKGTERRRLPFYASQVTIQDVAKDHNHKNEDGDIAHQVLQRGSKSRVIYLQHTTDKRDYQQYSNNRNSVGPIQFHSNW